ncbi:MAG: hypothetical protein Kow0079_09250 [Vicingaceae bacterium]
MLFIFISCKKNVDTVVKYNKTTIDNTIRLNKIIALKNGDWIAVGGKKNISGKIYKSSNKGKSWFNIYSTQQSIYDIIQIGDSVLFAGGNYLSLLHSKDNGENWGLFWFDDNVPIDEIDRTTIRKFNTYNDSVINFVGGDEYARGILYSSTNFGNDWHFQKFNHELRSIAFNGDENLIGGYGMVLNFYSPYQQVNNLNFTNDFITGIVWVNNYEAILVSSTGNVYNYQTHSKIFKKTDHISGQFNDLVKTNNKIYAIGNNGLICIINSDGTVAQQMLLEKSVHLLSATYMENKLWVCGSNGCLYEVIHF